jgi:SAM-dependent methyltransferase
MRSDSSAPSEREHRPVKRELLNLLRCFECAAPLTLERATGTANEIERGDLRCPSCSRTFPIVDSLPRFAAADNYTTSFGFQWQLFRRTQLDSQTGKPISRTRFFTESAWTDEQLHGSLVLDAGCGAGRFAEVALAAGATVVAIDFSNAVNACWANLGPHPRLHVVQADIYRLPFARGTFDFVYSFGVLQHTPDVERAFKALVPQLRSGGRIAIDVYPATPLNLLWPKYWLRPLTKRMPEALLYNVVQRTVPWLLPVSRAIGRIPRAGRKLRYAVPVVNYEGVLPLSEDQIKEWAVLDTFDMLSPVHDHPQSVQTVRQWFEDAKLADIDVLRRGLVWGRARKP